MGLGSASAIYVLAASAPPALVEWEPEDSKKYLRTMEMIGGKANVVASDIRQGFAGLWHGKSLAFTVATFSIVFAAAFWFLASRWPMGPGRET